MKSLKYNIKINDMKHLRNQIITNIERYYLERDHMSCDPSECYLFEDVSQEGLIVQRDDEDYFLIKGSYDDELNPEYGYYLSRTNMFSLIENWMLQEGKQKDLIIMYNIASNSLGWIDFEWELELAITLNYINFVREKVDDGILNALPIPII